ncbi:MAG: flagellar assembly protein FliW [Myxococcota bacterium]
MTAGGPLAITSPRLGRVELTEAQLIDFDGLPGFAELRRFAVVQHDRESPFGWLLSVERPELALLVADPRLFFPNYRPELEPAHLRALGAGDDDELDLLAIGRIEDGALCLNLAAPVVVNARNRRGVQAILERGGWSTHEIVPHK